MSRGGVDVARMSGAGNDFLVLGPEAAAELGEELIGWVRRVCRRGVSLGADGVVVVEPSGIDRVRVRFFNPDGSEAFCGNGSRCAARFARLRGMAGTRLRLETCDGEIPARIEGERVCLRLPAPRDGGEVEVTVDQGVLAGRLVVAGTPHFVVTVDRPEGAPLEHWGPVVRRDRQFAPAGTNLDLACGTGSERLVRTWEKGVDRETLACGSGAVAVAWEARRQGAGDRITVVPVSGIPLQVAFSPDGAAELSGDARLLLEGRATTEAVEGFPT